MKRIGGRWIGIMLVFSFLVSLFPAGVNAAGSLTGVSIQGIGVAGETLTAVVSGAGIDESQVSYQWYYGPVDPANIDKQQRTQPIAGATENAWEIDLSACLETAKTIPVGTYTYISDWAVWVKATYKGTTLTAGRNVAPGRNTMAVPQARAESDPAHVFRLTDGKEFIMLDQTETGESFVLAKDGYGRHAFDSANQYFSNEETKQTNIGYWLNHDFLTSGNEGQRLPEAMIAYLSEREWVSENLTNAATSEPISGIITTKASAKVGLLSGAEYNRYAHSIGTDDQLDFRWWLRSSTFANSAAAVILSGGGKTERYGMTGTGGIRPAFYLDNDFFANVKLDVYGTGEDVKAIIRNEYPDYAALSAAGYTTDELAALGYGVSAPTYGISGLIEGGEHLVSAALSQNGGIVSQGVVQNGSIVFDTPVTAGNYELTVAVKEGYERKAVALGGQTLQFENDSANITVTGAIQDLYLKLGENYGELISVKIMGDPVIGTKLQAQWSPAGIPAEELTFVWGYGPGGFSDARVKPIPNATGSTWTANYADLKTAKGEISDWPIWLRISYKGKNVDSVGFEIAPAKRTIPIEGAVEKSPVQHTFQVQGSDKTFTLLNTEADGKYFIIANDSYGVHKFNTSATSDYSVEKDGCIAQWLNDSQGGFPSEENTLPKDILEAIDWEHVWHTEAIANKDVAFLQTTQGVSLLSMNEYNTYFRNIGVHDFEGRWWLRSATQSSTVLAMDPDKLGTTTRMTPTNAYAVRPVFYLNQDFFTTCKLDVDMLGSEIKKILCDNIDQIWDLYTPDELKEITGEGRARLTSLSLRDELDQPVETVQPGTVTARAEFVNTSQTTAEAVIVLALYNNSNLVKLEKKEVEISAKTPSDETGTVVIDSVSLDIDTVEPGYVIKTFVWDSLDTLVPMGGTVAIDAKGTNLPFLSSRFRGVISSGTENLHK